MLRRAWWGPWPSLRASPFHTPALLSTLHNARPSSNAINTSLSQIATTLPCKATRLTNWKMFNSLPQSSSPRDMAPDTGSFSFEYLPNLNPSKGLKSLPNNSVRSTNYAQVAPSPLVNQLQSISVRPFSSYYCCLHPLSAAAAYIQQTLSHHSGRTALPPQRVNCGQAALTFFCITPVLTSFIHTFGGVLRFTSKVQKTLP